MQKIRVFSGTFEKVEERIQTMIDAGYSVVSMTSCSSAIWNVTVTVIFQK